MMTKARVEERPSLVLARTFPVAPEKVWRAWTDPAALRKWWNQTSAAGWMAELDVRPGGSYRIVMRGPDGRDHDVRGVYREVIPHRKLAFTWTVHSSTPELPRLAGESLVTVELRAVAGGTELKFRQEPMFDELARGGWNGAFKRLGQLLQQTD